MTKVVLNTDKWGETALDRLADHADNGTMSPEFREDLRAVVQLARHCFETVTPPAGIDESEQEAPHGWVCYNSGPCGWFWSESRSRLEHELSDDIREATALEKNLLGLVREWVKERKTFLSGETPQLREISKRLVAFVGEELP